MTMSEAKYFEGPKCRLGHTRRRISDGKCAECSAKTISKPDASEPLPPATERVSTGQCKHGIGLRAFCRDCETAWRQNPVGARSTYLGSPPGFRPNKAWS